MAAYPLSYSSSPDCTTTLRHTRIGQVVFEISYSHDDRYGRPMFGVYAPALDNGLGRGTCAPEGFIEAAMTALIDDELIAGWQPKSAKERYKGHTIEVAHDGKGYRALVHGPMVRYTVIGCYETLADALESGYWLVDRKTRQSR